MPIQSLRQYVTKQEVTEINGLAAADISDLELVEAESWIDAYCGKFISNSLRPALSSVRFEAEDTNFTSTKLVLPNCMEVTGHFLFSVLTVFDPETPALYNRKIAITGSKKVTQGHEITFAEVSGLSGKVPCEISQLGKFPIAGHCIRFVNSVGKSIPMEVKEAVAWQIKFMRDNAEMFDSPAFRSESISGSYSYSLAEGAEQDSLKKYIAPNAKKLLKVYNLSSL